MLSDTLFIQQSFINNLFYLRTLREFCLTIELSFYQNNESYITVAHDLGKKYEELGNQILKLANYNISKDLLDSKAFVTDYTLDCELLTEELFDIDIDTDLTVEEMNLNPIEDNKNLSNEILEELKNINENAIELTRGFIDFCQYLLESRNNNLIFSYNYPLIYRYMIEEASLYANDLYRIQNRTSVDPTFIANYEYYFCNSMKLACQFIIGLSDPNQTAIITNANNYRKIFQEKMKRYQEENFSPDALKLENEHTIEQVKSLIDFFIKIITGILNNELSFNIFPLFFDNLLTEAYYFLYLLRGANYGIQN